MLLLCAIFLLAFTGRTLHSTLRKRLTEEGAKARALAPTGEPAHFASRLSFRTNAVCTGTLPVHTGVQLVGAYILTLLQSTYIRA
jgi:hypothetical protein